MWWWRRHFDESAFSVQNRQRRRLTLIRFRTAVAGRIELKRVEFVIHACVGDSRNEKIFELNVTQNRWVQMSINRYIVYICLVNQTAYFVLIFLNSSERWSTNKQNRNIFQIVSILSNVLHGASL